MEDRTSIAPFSYSGSLRVPFSKSYLQRAIAISALSSKPTKIYGFTAGNDALAAMQIAEALGAKCERIGNELTITPITSRNQEKVEINCGESGLSTRMFTPIVASISNKTIVSGEGSILTRPMDMVIDALEKLGAKVISENEKLPLEITGKIQPGPITIDASESSQLLTGLLIALSFLPEPSTVHVTKVKSIPYVQMTLDILKEFGVEIEQDEFLRYDIPDGPISDKVCTAYSVEGDWSGASFHVVGAAISGRIKLQGLNKNSAQSDLAILEVVKKAGARVHYSQDAIEITQESLKAFSFDATNCPDLFPPIAALAACCEGVSEVKGVSRLASKESNRGLTIQSELGKLGIRITLDGDTMRIYGGSVTGGEIDSCNDHRIAMMGAILATQTDEDVIISNPKAVAKSYPNFFEDIHTISKA